MCVFTSKPFFLIVVKKYIFVISYWSNIVVEIFQNLQITLFWTFFFLFSSQIIYNNGLFLFIKGKSNGVDA